MMLLQEFLKGSTLDDQLHEVKFVFKHFRTFFVHFCQLFVWATTKEESDPVYEANVKVMLVFIFGSSFGPRMHFFRGNQI